MEDECSKCGSEFISTSYEAIVDGLGDRLKKVCNRCGYWWHENVLIARTKTRRNEMEAKEPKFKVGDWVTVKGMPQDKEAFHILEINQQLCEAGIAQIRYLVRHFFKIRLEMDNISDIGDRWTMSIKEAQVREMEVGELTKMPS